MPAKLPSAYQAYGDIDASPTGCTPSISQLCEPSVVPDWGDCVDSLQQPVEPEAESLGLKLPIEQRQKRPAVSNSESLGHQIHNEDLHGRDLDSFVGFDSRQDDEFVACSPVIQTLATERVATQLENLGSEVMIPSWPTTSESAFQPQTSGMSWPTVPSDSPWQASTSWTNVHAANQWPEVNVTPVTWTPESSMMVGPRGYESDDLQAAGRECSKERTDERQETRQQHAPRHEDREAFGDVVDASSDVEVAIEEERQCVRARRDDEGGIAEGGRGGQGVKPSTFRVSQLPADAFATSLSFVAVEQLRWLPDVSDVIGETSFPAAALPAQVKTHTVAFESFAQSQSVGFESWPSGSWGVGAAAWPTDEPCAVELTVHNATWVEDTRFCGDVTGAWPNGNWRSDAF